MIVRKEYFFFGLRRHEIVKGMTGIVDDRLMKFYQDVSYYIIANRFSNDLRLIMMRKERKFIVALLRRC